MEFLHKYNSKLIVVNKYKVWFVNKGLIRKEVGKEGCAKQHILDVCAAKQFGIYPKETSLKDFNQGSDMTWHVFEKDISASVRRMNWLGVKANSRYWEQFKS